MEPHPLVGKSVDVRSYSQPIAITPKMRSVIFAGDPQNVGTLTCERWNGEESHSEDSHGFGK
jgi:hypothetical protein